MSDESAASRSAGEGRPVLSSFDVGPHIVRLSCSEGHWTVTVDSVASEKWYTSQAEAWEAGVREADRLARLGST
jgi:hypothetical protein